MKSSMLRKVDLGIKSPEVKLMIGEYIYVICRLGGPYSENCDRGLENAARGRRPRAAFSSPR